MGYSASNQRSSTPEWRLTGRGWAGRRGIVPPRPWWRQGGERDPRGGLAGALPRRPPPVDGGDHPVVAVGDAARLAAPREREGPCRQLRPSRPPRTGQPEATPKRRRPADRSEVATKRRRAGTSAAPKRRLAGIVGGAEGAASRSSVRPPQRADRRSAMMSACPSMPLETRTDVPASRAGTTPLPSRAWRWVVGRGWNQARLRVSPDVGKVREHLEVSTPARRQRRSRPSGRR